jgi:hypothetical protein
LEPKQLLTESKNEIVHQDIFSFAGGSLLRAHTGSGYIHSGNLQSERCRRNHQWADARSSKWGYDQNSSRVVYVEHWNHRSRQHWHHNQRCWHAEFSASNGWRKFELFSDRSDIQHRQ